MTINSLQLFKGTPSIKNFLIEDFFTRAKVTIEAIGKNDFKDYFENGTPVLVENFREKLKLEAYLDPMNLLLLSTQFIEQKYIEDEKMAETLIAFIDLDLVYTMILALDDVSRVSLLLLKQAKYHVRMVMENLEHFRGKAKLLKRLFQNGLLKALISKVTNFGDIKNHPRQQSLLELASQITDLKQKVEEVLSEKVVVDLGICEGMNKYFSAIATLKDGQNFTG